MNQEEKAEALTDATIKRLMNINRARVREAVFSSDKTGTGFTTTPQGARVSSRRRKNKAAKAARKNNR